MKETEVRLVRKRKQLSRKKNVAAYARVSTTKDAMLHSLSAQVSYYSELIQSTPGWLYVGAYVDEGITGTKGDRPNFNRLLNDAREGKIDLIITKSISRFARNTITLLETIRELKQLNVDVYFEEQNINSISADGELILTFLASYAQEESKSASENIKWSIRNGFKKGIAWNTNVLGYQFNKGKPTIIEDEAKVVKYIFQEYLSGKGTIAIAKELNEKGYLTKLNRQWRHGGVAYVLRNYLYTGNMLLQSTFKDSFITKRKVINHGELPRYHAENTHEAIISLDTFMEVQNVIKERQNARKPQPKSNKPTIYRDLLICEHCGKKYRRKVTGDKSYWMCATYNMLGREACPSKQIPEPILSEIITKVLDIKDLTNANIKEQINHIMLNNNQELKIQFKDGRISLLNWHHKSRKHSWTPEMKEAARRKAKEVVNEKNNGNSVNN